MDNVVNLTRWKFFKAYATLQPWCKELKRKTTMQEKNQLTIAFHPDGTVQHTLLDKFMRPDFSVPRQVERMTDIRHESAIDVFYVIGLLDPIKGRYFDTKLLDEAGVNIDGIPHKKDRRGVLLFGSYDDAVRCEIRVIDAIRSRGEIVGSNLAPAAAIDLDPSDYSEIK